MPATTRRSLARLAALLMLFASMPGSPASASLRTQKPLVAPGEVAMTKTIADALKSLPASSPYALFVHFEGGSLERNKALVEGHGLTVTSEFPSVNVVYAWGTIGEIRGLTREPAVSYLEHNRKITFLQNTTVWATRARAAHEAVAGGPYFDPNGQVLDGGGVGIAVVDSGVDGTHPDLAGRIEANFKVVCTTPFLISTTTEQCFGPVAFVDLGPASFNDDLGHGTHVAGIALGDGTSSTGDYGDGVAPNVEGSFTGVAPGGHLYGFGVATGGVFLTIAESFQWILDNNADLDVPIRVVNNSWGSVPISGEPELPHDPNSIEAKLVNALVGSGVTVVFAAANRGGNGASDRTSPECKNPTPGVICVANYNDAGTGSRDNVLVAGSSRGRAGAPHTYPDISAPGASIHDVGLILLATAVAAPCRPGVLPDCVIASDDWPGFYSLLNGTSMAAPHVAGAAALLYQAVPGITPAQVEKVIKDTAHKFTFGGAYEPDPANPGGTTSFDKGAGLLDVKAALDALGIPHAGQGLSPDPQVGIQVPLDGTTFDGSSQILVEGTAHDGTSVGTPPPAILVADGDENDFAGPGAADLVALTVRETPAGASPGGFTYEVEVRDAEDFGNGTSVTLQLIQNVHGRDFLTRVTMDATAVTPVEPSSLVTAPATEAGLMGDIVSFFVPYANLGDPPPGSIGHNVQMQSLLGTVMDAMPGRSATALADFQARPQYARPYTILRPDLATEPETEVFVSTGTGDPVTATLVGSSPLYTWNASVDPEDLDDGEHTLTATLLLDGMPAATATVTIVIERPLPRTYEVLITDPAPGATVARADVPVAGTAFTDDPSTDRAVTVEVVGPEPSAEAAASGVEAWTTTIDFDRQAGDYTLVARLYVDGVERSAHQIDVVVPPAIDGDQVSCAPMTINGWRHEYGNANSPHRFTAAERGAILDRAVTLSSGLFASGEELRAALFYSGQPLPRPAAGRQFAALLLNLAAGDLSATMSKQAGLSGGEGLDPALYTTKTVGSTVEAARAWIRAQFPDGNLGGAAEVASAINNGHGLLC